MAEKITICEDGVAVIYVAGKHKGVACLTFVGTFVQSIKWQQEKARRPECQEALKQAFWLRVDILNQENAEWVVAKEWYSDNTKIEKQSSDQSRASR